MANKLGKLSTPFVNAYDRFPKVDKASGKMYAYSVIASMKLDNIDDEKEKKFNSYIMGVSIEKNFEKLFCPMVKLVLVIPRGESFSLQDTFRDNSLFLTIEKHIVNDRNNGVEITPPEPVYKGTEFTIVHIDGDSFLDDTTNSGEITNYPTKNTDADTVITLYLYEKKALEVKRPLMNKVYNNITVSDVINYLISENFKDRSIIVDKPDNEEVYEQIFIPPLNFPDALEYLQAFYGVYRSGIESFMDLDAVYIISKDSKAKFGDYYRDMNIRVRSVMQQDPQSRSRGSRSTFIDKESKSVNITLDTLPIIKSGDVISKEFIGEQLFISNDKSFNTAIGGGGINPSEDESGKERYLWAKSSSKFATDEIALKINRNTESAHFVVQNSDIVYFNPVTLVHLGYAYKINANVEAKYRFSLVLSTFTRDEDSTLDKTYSNLFYVKTYAKFIRV